MNVSLGVAVFVLIANTLAVMRLTRLVNYDTILDTPRIAVAKIFGRESAAVYFLGCPWCVGFWLSLAMAPLPVLYIGLELWWIPIIGLATSYLVGLVAPLTADDEMVIEEVEASGDAD